MLTGETGAGKTLLADALDLLLGGRARRGIVRPGAAEAYVEGVFALPAGARGGRTAPRRRTGARAGAAGVAGRPYARVRVRARGDGGRPAELGGALVCFYGQHEHRKLMLSATQLDMLDAHCGSAHHELRARVQQAYERARELAQRVDRAGPGGRRARPRARPAAFELGEIEAAARPRPRRASCCSSATGCATSRRCEAAAAPAPRRSRPRPATAWPPRLRRPPASSSAPAGSIRGWPRWPSALQALRYEAEDVGGELRDYLRRDATAPPAAWKQVEERLAALQRLARKHGGAIADVLAHATRCRERLEELEHADVALAQAEAEPPLRGGA